MIRRVSWFIAGQALRLADSGDINRARLLLLHRHEDISPFVVKDPAFQRLLTRLGLLDPAPNASEMSAAEAREAARRRVANASQIVKIALVIGVVISVLRLLALLF